MRGLHVAACLGLLAAVAPASAGACELASPADEKLPLVTRKPVAGADVRLTSGFGIRFHPLLNERRMHTGIDWAAPKGTPVVAAGAGRVAFAGRRGQEGNTVVIDHGAAIATAYAHLSGFDVHEGDCVAAGARIGSVGSTGLAAGPMLHFEVRRGGVPVDPLKIPLESLLGQ